MKQPSFPPPPPREKNTLFWVHFLTGFGDGLLLPLSATLLLAAFTAPALPPLAAGLLVTLLGALIFGWARYAGEYDEIRQHNAAFSRSEMERESNLLHYIGIDKELIDRMRLDREHEKEQWRLQLRENGIPWDKPDRRRAMHGGLQTGAGFLCGGLLCLLPFFFEFGWGAVNLRGLFRFAYPALLVWPLILLAAQGFFRALLVRRSAVAGVIRYVAYGLLVFFSLYLILLSFQPELLRN